MNEEATKALLSQLETEHGPLLSVRVLTKLLDFGTQEACQKAIRTGALTVPAFRIRGRPGYFVLTREFVPWLLTTKAANPATTKPASTCLNSAAIC